MYQQTIEEHAIDHTLYDKLIEARAEPDPLLPRAFSPFDSLIPLSIGSKLSKVSNYTSSLPVTLAESTSKEKVTLILSPQTPSAPMAPRVTTHSRSRVQAQVSSSAVPSPLATQQSITAILEADNLAVTTSIIESTLSLLKTEPMNPAAQELVVVATL